MSKPQYSPAVEVAGPPRRPSSGTVHPPQGDKLRAEIAKLEAETREILSRLQERDSFSGLLRTWSGVLLGLLTIAAAGWGLYEGSSRFFEQRDRQLEYQVSQELISLTNQLEDPAKAANAALLLSAFEEHAVPILVAKLRTAEPWLAEHLVMSLELVAAKERIRRNPAAVARPLLEQARLLADILERGSGPSGEASAALVVTVHAVGKVLQHVEDDAMRAEALQVLHELQTGVAGDDSPMPELERKDLRARIDRAIQRLGTGP